MTDYKEGIFVNNLKDRYDIYVACMEGSGEYIKTFEEWASS
jgi:hypothetical protein